MDEGEEHLDDLELGKVVWFVISSQYAGHELMKSALGSSVDFGSKII